MSIYVRNTYKSRKKINKKEHPPPLKKPQKLKHNNEIKINKKGLFRCEMSYISYILTKLKDEFFLYLHVSILDHT